MRKSTSTGRITSAIATWLAGLAVLVAMQGASAEEAIKIGAPLALTGGLSEEGRKQQAAYQVWMEKVNAAGGIAVGSGAKRPVELVYYDYQTNAKRAQQLAERLITVDKVHVMTAPFGSGHTKVVAGVAERYGMPIVAVASSEPVHDQGYINLFGTLAPSVGLIDIMIEQIRQSQPQIKKIGVLGRDDVFPKIMARTMVKQAKLAQLEVVYDELYPVGALDHTSALTLLKQARPDWVFVTGYTNDLVLIRKQMTDLRLNVQALSMITGPAYQEFVDSLGDLAENVTSATWWHPSQSYEADDVFGSTKAFTDAMIAKTGKEPDYVHASSAAALIVIQKALQSSSSLEPDSIRAAIAATDIKTFYGPIKFRADGLNQNRNLPIIQIQEGERVVVYPASTAGIGIRPVSPGN